MFLRHVFVRDPSDPILQHSWLSPLAYTLNEDLLELNIHFADKRINHRTRFDKR